MVEIEQSNMLLNQNLIIWKGTRCIPRIKERYIDNLPVPILLVNRTCPIPSRAPIYQVNQLHDKPKCHQFLVPHSPNFLSFQVKDQKGLEFHFPLHLCQSMLTKMANRLLN